MELVIFNLEWMGVNIGLAGFAVLFGYLAYRFRKTLPRILFLILWFLFVPNTIYIFTDLLHLPEQLYEAGNIGKIAVSFEYLVLEIAGFLSFIIAVYFFERILESISQINKTLIPYIIVVLNVLIGFGVILGRIQRVNSWDIFVDTEGVIYDSLTILTSFEQIILVVFFGVLGNLVYFLCRDNIISVLRKFGKIL